MGQSPVKSRLTFRVLIASPYVLLPTSDEPLGRTRASNVRGKARKRVVKFRPNQGGRRPTFSIAVPSRRRKPSLSPTSEIAVELSNRNTGAKTTKTP